MIKIVKLCRAGILLLLMSYAQMSYGILHLVLTQGVESAMPIAIVPFANDEATGFSKIIGQDLSNSGQFTLTDTSNSQHQPTALADVQLTYWRKQNADYLLVGQVSNGDDGNAQVQIALINVFQNNGDKTGVMFDKTYPVDSSQPRATAHQISDDVYQAILGQPGFFASKIAYVLLQHSSGQAPEYSLMTADYDGFNPQAVLQTQQPIMSPAWSPDGKKLAYVSFASGTPAIYIKDLISGKQQLVTRFPGINGAPAFSPDGSKLALVLSKGVNPNIYVVNLHIGKLQQVTHSYSIDTEPTWTPDGRSLLFTSDRGGSPQIYQVTLGKKGVKRLTFDGRYNAHPSLSADGQQLLVLHKGEDSLGKYAVAVQNLRTGKLKVLTSDGAQSPSFSPNGSMVIYAKPKSGNQSELAMVSIDGGVQLQLPNEQGSALEPVWSSLNNKFEVIHADD